MLDNLDQQAAELIRKLSSPEALAWAQKTAEFMMSTWVKEAYLRGLIMCMAASVLFATSAVLIHKGINSDDSDTRDTCLLIGTVTAIGGLMVICFGLHTVLVPEAYALAKWVALIRGG